MALFKEWQIDNLPINVLIGEKYYDIDEFFFDKEINEYILKLSGGIEYNTRAEIIHQGDKKGL